MCIVVILGTPLPADECVAFAAMRNRVGRRVDPRCALQLHGRARRSLQSRRRRPILRWGCHQASRCPDGHPNGCILMINTGYFILQETDFQSRQSMKRKLDESIATGIRMEQPSERSQRLPAVPQPTDAESSAFLAALNETQDRAVLLSVTAEHAERYVPTYFGDISLPKVMAELYEEPCTEMPTEQLREHFDGISVTDVQSKNIEKITRAQSACKEWYQFRAVRATASRMKAVCSTPLERPSPSLVKTITLCYPHTTKLSTHATRWGCDHEPRALQRYCEVSQTTHTSFKDSGLIINTNMPYKGASPDSVVSCDCCGIGVVEVKCPFCLGKSVLSDKADSLVVIGGKLQLSKKHAHYYQVQTQMFVCDRMYAD